MAAGGSPQQVVTPITVWQETGVLGTHLLSQDCSMQEVVVEVSDMILTMPAPANQGQERPEADKAHTQVTTAILMVATLLPILALGAVEHLLDTQPHTMLVAEKEAAASSLYNIHAWNNRAFQRDTQHAQLAHTAQALQLPHAPAVAVHTI